MERLRLDPSDPLGSVMAWIAALVAALGIEVTLDGPLPRADGALIRRWLADWMGQLRNIVRVEALCLARVLRLRTVRRAPVKSPTKAQATEIVVPSPLWGGDQGVGGGHHRAAGRRRTAPRMRPPTPPTLRVDSPPHTGEGVRALAAPRSELLSPEEEAALKRRIRAVKARLADPLSDILRLAVRLARKLARARASWDRGRGRRPAPPRVLGDESRFEAPAPEPRPPNASASVPA